MNIGIVQKTKLFLSTALIAITCGHIVEAATVEIKIDGIPGAQHWLWYEAEYATNLSNFARFGSDHAYASGGGVYQANFCIKYTGDQNPSAIFDDIIIPSEMQDARLYVRCNGAQSRTATVYGNDVEKGTFLIVTNNYNYQNPVYWQEQPIVLGSISQGVYKLQIDVDSAGWVEALIDGFFISDGPLAVSNTPITPEVSPGGSGTYSWLYAPADISTHNITGSVTPVFSITGQTDTIEYSLNSQPYTPGTPINTIGDYQLTVTVFDDTTRPSGLKKMRYMVGANFSIVPAGTIIVIH